MGVAAVMASTTFRPGAANSEGSCSKVSKHHFAKPPGKPVKAGTKREVISTGKQT